MKIKKRLAALPLTALVSLVAHAQHAPTPADEAAAARANAEQNQQVQQQRDAQQRAAIVDAPAARSTVPTDHGYPVLPIEQPCFKVDAFALDVPAALPASIRDKGSSALPLDRFAFAREWLTHYAGQCVGKDGVNVLTKGLQQTILSHGYKGASTGAMSFRHPSAKLVSRFTRASTMAACSDRTRHSSQARNSLAVSSAFAVVCRRSTPA